MVDNSSIPVASGNETFANNDIGGIRYPRVKLVWGAPGAANDASAANPIPVSGTVAVTGTVTANVGTGTQPVSGTVTVNGISTTAPDRGAGATTAQTMRVSIASEQVEVGEYKAVPASATTTLGATGAVGDFLSAVIIVPGTTSPGAVSIKDGSDTAIPIFTGGATSVSNLVPFVVSVGATSRTGAWQLVLGANITAIGTGNFT